LSITGDANLADGLPFYLRDASLIKSDALGLISNGDTIDLLLACLRHCPLLQALTRVRGIIVMHWVITTLSPYRDTANHFLCVDHKTQNSYAKYLQNYNASC